MSQAIAPQYLSVSDVIKLILKQKWIIAVTTIIMVILGVVFQYVWVSDSRYSAIIRIAEFYDTNAMSFKPVLTCQQYIAKWRDIYVPKLVAEQLSESAKESAKLINFTKKLRMFTLSDKQSVRLSVYGTDDNLTLYNHLLDQLVDSFDKAELLGFNKVYQSLAVTQQIILTLLQNSVAEEEIISNSVGNNIVNATLLAENYDHSLLEQHMKDVIDSDATKQAMPTNFVQIENSSHFMLKMRIIDYRERLLSELDKYNITGGERVKTTILNKFTKQVIMPRSLIRDVLTFALFGFFIGVGVCCMVAFAGIKSSIRVK